jgi:polyvinyl alcohol dehydrogenase (cytochrome)
MKLKLPFIALSVGIIALGCERRGGWPMAGYDLTACNFNPDESELSPRNVSELRTEWTFDESKAGRRVRPMHATPVVDEEGNSYIGDFGGVFFSISASGALRWSFTAEAPTPEVGALLSPEIAADGAPFLGAAAIADELPYIVVADANGRVYARDRDTGAEVWTTRGLTANPLGGVAGNSLVVFRDVVLVGMSSLENYALVLSGAGLRVDCCSHQGALVALDLATGSVRWRYETSPSAEPLPVALAPFVLGPSGAGIWSQPSLDPATGTIYVSTGQNLSPDSAGRSNRTSDAIIAVDARSGREKWVHQFTRDDIWAVGVPNPHPVTGQLLDMDLGDSPKLYKLPDGRKVVGAGQKDGRFHVLDALTGGLVHTEQVVAARNDLGGFQTGGAAAYGLVFQHGLDATDGFTSCKEGSCPYEGFKGVVVALSGNGKNVRWRVDVPASPLIGGLAVANDLVYFQSPVEEASPGQASPEWGLYAVDARSGAIKKRMTFPGRALGSPVVADGHVYVTTGNGALPFYGVVAEGSLMRLGRRGQDD